MVTWTRFEDEDGVFYVPDEYLNSPPDTDPNYILQRLGEQRQYEVWAWVGEGLGDRGVEYMAHKFVVGPFSTMKQGKAALLMLSDV